MAKKLHWKQGSNAQSLLNEVYNEIKISEISDEEIAEIIQFMWYNLDTEKYEIIYFKVEDE